MTANKLQRLAIIAVAACCSQLNAASIEFDSFYYYFNNADFRNYSAEQYKANQATSFLNGDDRTHLIFGNVRLKYQTKYKKTEFKADISRWAYWGTDNFQGRDAGQNPFTFRDLNFTWYPTDKITFLFGRYTYNIGNTRRDYFFHDIIDGGQLEFKFNPNFKLQVMGDIFSNAMKPDIAGYLGAIKKDPEQIDDFNGDTITARFGGFFQAYFAKLFSYYVRYGANTQGGADLSENGRNPLNKADGDFLSMNGIRLSKDFQTLGSVDLTASYSYGKDYQFDATRTYNAFAGAMNYHKKFEAESLKYEPGFSGGWFDPNYASMKAASMGGTLLWQYKAYFASPHAYFYHFRDYGKRADQQQYIDRTNSKTFVKMSHEFQFKKTFLRNFTFEPTVMALLQTSGYEYMGTEIEIMMNYRVDNIKFAAAPAVYLPSNYYTKYATTNTFVPNGNDPFFGFGFTLTYILDLDYIGAQKAEVEDEVQDKSEDILDEAGGAEGNTGFTVD